MIKRFSCLVQLLEHIVSILFLAIAQRFKFGQHSVFWKVGITLSKVPIYIVFPWKDVEGGASILEPSIKSDLGTTALQTSKSHYPASNPSLG